MFFEISASLLVKISWHPSALFVFYLFIWFFPHLFVSLCPNCKRRIMKIFAIGMNYAAHNQELHGTLKRPDEPVIFTKADSAILNRGKPFFIPDHLGRIDYKTEVVVRFPV